MIQSCRRYAVCLLIIAGCGASGEKADETDKAGSEGGFERDTVVVSVSPVETRPFEREIFATGKVYAERKAVLLFQLNELITEVPVKNGDFVATGQVLLKHDHVNVERRYQRSKDFYEKALIDLDDKLIDLGYRLSDSLKIPPAVFRMAKVKSGYNAAHFEYVSSIREMSMLSVKAPFSGLVANLEASPYNMPESFRKVCTLIDDSRLMVDFFILESERKLAKTGAAVTVSAMDDSSHVQHAYITEVNPVIDENGMIRVKGRLTNKGHAFIDGMPVRVVVSGNVKERLMVPVPAVLVRQDKTVVFTFDKGKAIWNYVECGERNSTYIEIKAGLERGQLAIVSGNSGLVHESFVRLAN